MTESDESFSDLYRFIDRAHRETAEADDVPAFVWSRVRAETRTNVVEEKPPMSMNLAVASPVFTRPQPEVGALQRFSGMVATLAIVAVLAFGGWFAATNLPTSGGPEPRYAALGIQQETAGNGVCEVEPLTVDQAVRIVQNPIAVAHSESATIQADGPDGMSDLTNWVGAPRNDWDTLVALAAYTAIPVTDDEYFSLMAFTEEYKDCLFAGTKGQIWAMTDPVVVQYEIVTRIPLLQPMDVTEAAIADLLAAPNVRRDSTVVVTRQWQPNPDRELMVRVDAGVTITADSSYVIPWQILDGNGDVLASYDIFGNSLLDDHVSDTDPGNLVVIRSGDGKSWYVVGGFESSQYADAPAE